MGMIGLHALDDAACVVGGHAISDEDFQAIMGVVLGKDGIQAALDIGSFVANRDEDGDEGGFIQRKFQLESFDTRILSF